MKVRFVPQNVEFEIKPGESVMHVAQDHDLYIKSVCKGVPSCAECRVRVTEGEHNVLPPGSEELSLIGTGHFIDRRRLSCQLKCFGDITVDMSEQIAKQQGLIGGQKKKKLAIKDDRIEDSHSIRAERTAEDESSESPIEGGAENELQAAAADSANPPRMQSPNAPARDQRSNRPRQPSQQPQARGGNGGTNSDSSGEGKNRGPRRRRGRGRGRGGNS